MSGFLDVRFPTDIAIGMTGGPKFHTEIITNRQGFETRSIITPQCRYEFTVDLGIKNRKSIESLLNLFHLAQGMTYAFRFKDWQDYSFSEQLIGEGDGVTTNFPLYKEYKEGSYVSRRRIIKPRAESFMMHDFCTKDYECDWQSGVITFKTAPPAGCQIVVSGEFDVPVRFAIEALEITNITPQLFRCQPIKLIEVKG